DALDTGGTGARPAARATRPIIPGERQFRDGDRVRHARWGDGLVLTRKLTRSDEEVTVAFKDASVGRKTMLVSLANLDLVGGPPDRTRWPGSSGCPSSSRLPGLRWIRRRSTSSRAGPGTRSRSPRTR